MTNIKLTDRGRNLLAPLDDAAGAPKYWIGYYALAYVPNRENDSLADAVRNNKLTSSGDVIYNIWQGDMVNGYATENPDDTAAASLFGLTLYGKSIRTNYRYVYVPGDGRSEKPHNTLVAWESVSDGHGENTLVRKGAAVYNGATDESASELPIPAPLYYRGEPDVGNVSNSVNNDEPDVSADYRYYVGTRSGGPYGWQDSANTQSEQLVDDPTLLQSISNFNKFHGPVSSEGYGVSSVSSCHNMSKATKYFPISHYTVVNDNGKKVAETKNTSPNATAIKYTIDLTPITSDVGYTALNYEAGDSGDDQDAENQELYTSKHISFRFNRVGIYAVPMSIHRYSTDRDAEGCNLQKVQFEIDGDAEPILVAVADVNDTIISDNPNEGGVAKFGLDFIIHVPDESELETSTAVYYNLYENDATTWYKNQLLASASISEAVTDLSLEMNAIKQQVGGAGRECCAQTTNHDQYAPRNHTHDYLKNLVDGIDKPGAVRGIYTREEGDGRGIASPFGDGVTPETMFAGGYSAGPNSLVLGDSTAASGKNSIVQGKLAYSNSDYTTILGSEAVRCKDSTGVTMLGASGYNVSDSDGAILFGNGFDTSEEPPEVSGLHNSILSGRFAGFDGAVRGSVLIGDMHLGNNPTIDAARNALVLRTGDDPAYSVRGQITDSIAIGEGISASAKFPGGHDPDVLDKNINIEKSLNIAGNTHNYLTPNLEKWYAFKLTTPEMPAMKCAIQVGGCIDQNLQTSLFLSSGKSELGYFSINNTLTHVSSKPVLGAHSSILIGDSNVYGESIKGIIAVGEQMYVPNNSNYSIVVGSVGVPDWKNDVVMTPDEFTQHVTDEDLTLNAHYVILGDGTIKISDGLGGYVDQVLSGASDGIYAGVFVDADGVITYTPVAKVIFAPLGYQRTLGEYDARLARLNPEKLDYSLVLGGQNSIDSTNTRNMVMVGNSNTIERLSISNVSVFGNETTINGQAYWVSNSKPVYPHMTNTHIFGSGLTLDLSSTDVYATHSFDNAIINLTSDYNAVLSGTLGIFPHPMRYFSMPYDNVLNIPWKIGFEATTNDTGMNKEPFHIDPCYFDNYEKAWIRYDSINGEATWAAYRTEIGYGTGASYDDWRAVTEIAEGIQTENDVYHGHSLYGYDDPFDGMTRAQIREAVGKPNAPMVYTGGIALAGFPTGTNEYNYGLIKLGHESKPVAYINASPVTGWGAADLLCPTSITGTTTCPYGGMVLAVDGKQELDGTLHLVLRKNVPTSNTRFGGDLDYENCTADADIEPRKGMHYIVGCSDGVNITILRNDDHMNYGDECCVVVKDSSEGTVTVEGISTGTYGNAIGDLIGEHTLSSGHSYLLRKVEYTEPGEITPKPVFMVTQLA